MSYNSKYTGAEVENLLDQVANGNTGGGSSGSVDLSGYATKEELNGKVDKVDGKQLSTEDFTTTLKEKLDELSNYDDTTISEAVEKLRTDFDTLVSGDTTTAIKTFNEIIAFLDGIEDSESLDSIIASIEQQIAAKYTKPSTGIPKSDLNSDVQTSLGKADTALQEHQDISGKQDTLVSGTNIKTINGESILGSGDITIEGGSDVTIPTKLSELENDLGFVEKENTGYNFDNDITVTGRIITSDGFVGFLRTMFGAILDFGSDGSITIYDSNGDTTLEIIANGDGTKFLANDGTYKTIETGSTSSGSAAYPLVEHGTSDTTFTLTPNTFHVWDEVASLDLSFGEETSGVANEFLFQFTSGATATTLTLPDDIKWANDTAPTIAENMIYQVSVLRGLASVLEFNNAAELIENLLTYDKGSFSTGATITFQYPVASDITIYLDYYSTYSVVMAAGESTMTLDWFEPQAPQITSILPSQDNTYIYMY